MGFITSYGGQGRNILEKIQLTSDGTGVEFFKNINQFKSKFIDKVINNLHILPPFQNRVDFFEIGRFPKNEKYP